jgi:LPXTG-motif cell wall-anchored protein
LPPKPSFFAKYKWPLLVGGLAVLGGGAYFVMRKKRR